MERNSNRTNNINCVVDTKTGRTVLSFEELKVLRERKLTQEEADFSEEHLSIVWWFLNEKKLSADDWFDVVVLRYLLTVKRWFTLPELRRYSFTTLAVSSMKSAVNTERRKQNWHRHPQTISLDAPHKGIYGAPLLECLAG